MRPNRRLNNVDEPLKQAREELYEWGAHYKGGGAFLSYSSQSSEQAAIDGHAKGHDEIPERAYITEQRVLSLPRWAQVSIIQYYTIFDDAEKNQKTRTFYRKLERAENEFLTVSL